MIAALAFLSVLGRAGAPTPASLRWFPAGGLAIGACVGGVWWAAAQVWPPLVAACVAVAADLVLTGMLHLDGLADAGDGLLAPLDRERRLAVMADPATGAFGVGTVVGVLLLRWSCLAALEPHVLLVAGLWAASRTAMAVVVHSRPYARTEGLVSGLRHGPGSAAVLGVLGLALGGAAAWWAAGPLGALAVGGVALGSAGVVALAQRRLGGYTGDVLGAAGVVGETAGLLVAAARW